MTISLEAISFNHDPVSTTRDAFTIRKNGTEDVAVPEWTRGTTLPQDSPAAYSIRQISANNLTIKAQFRRLAADPTSAVVHAIGRSGNVLGNVRSRTITFQNGLSTFDLFELDAPPGSPGVGRWDISWDWFVDGTFAQTTQHRIYTLVDAPKEPWGQLGSPPDFQLPWTEVLEHACVAATGARNVDDAAALLTRWVFSLGGSKLKYNDQGSGTSCFTIQGMDAFKCTSFLEALKNGHGTRQTVNCVDCATILSSFANILGCELTQSKIGFEFKTNFIQKIGSTTRTTQEFKFHEVAWKFPSSGSPTIFDSCLQIDGDSNPTDDNFLPILGINFPMGSPTGTAYHGRLIRPTRRGREAREFPLSRRQRKIDNGGGVLRALPAEPTQLRILADEYDFPEWSETPKPIKQDCGYQHENTVAVLEKSSTSEQSLFLKNYSAGKGQKSPTGWKPGEAKSYKAVPEPLQVTDAVWLSEDCSGAALRVLTYECSSIASARSFLLGLLAEFQVPGIQRRREFNIGDKPVKIGDVAFTGSDEVVLLFARANNVLFIQNVGRTLVSVSQFAREMDEDMASDPEPEKGQMSEMQHFKLSNTQVSVGDEILIHASPEFVKKEKKTWFKFFAPAGHVFARGDELLYRCVNAGEQSISILASQAEGETARQVLTVFAEPAANSKESPCPDVENPIKEETVMPDVAKIIGVWSSIRPTTDGEESADMRVDGYIEIKHRDPDTGIVSGFYRDEEARSTTELLTGQVVLVNSHFYMNLQHPVGEGVTRFYEGEFVHDDGTVQLVAGKYYDRFESNETGDVPVAAASTDSLAALDGQENGTWVATKP